MTVTTFDWSAVAPAWDAHRAQAESTTSAVTTAVLDALALEPGQDVLELGAGTGDFAVDLAGRVAPGGRVLASDIAPGMVALLARAADGVDNLGAAEIDAAAIGRADAEFDAVVFRMGLMFVPEPVQALRECCRVLRDGGRLAVAVWAGPEHNPWLSSIGMAAMVHGVVVGGPPTGPGGLFSLADPDRLQSIAETAGFEQVEVRSVATTARFVSTDEHFATVSALAGPLAVALGSASTEQVEKVRQTAAELAEPHRTDEGLVLPGRALLLTARAAARPAS
ncbi:MAG: Methyltransferase type 11 [Frankiales bacterium]|nr:Methyltransferase type 11 [Frankiales bacterium]